MDNSPIASISIGDRSDEAIEALLTTLGNMRPLFGSDLARYNRLLDLVYDSDGTLQLDADMLDFYNRIMQVTQ